MAAAKLLQGTAIRVLIFTNILPPYRIPLYNRLAEDPLLDVTTVLLAENEANRKWKLDNRLPFVHLLTGRSLYFWRWEIPVHVNYGVTSLLRSIDPDVVVIGGWDQPAYWVATRWATRMRVPVVLQNESTLLSATRTRGIWLRLKRWMVQSSTAYMAYGTKAKEYLLFLGAEPARIHVGLNTVDVEWFAAEAMKFQASDDAATRDARLRVLYVGQLIPRKAVDLLLRAVARADPTGSRIRLVIVGSGPDEERLRRLIHRLGLKNVAMEGFKQPLELPRYYAWADVLVLPSVREVWGLVVNEALASGVYVICSDRVGAGFDLITPAWNGEVFPSGDEVGLATALKQALDNLERIRTRRVDIMRDAIDRFSITQEANALVSAITFAAHASDRLPAKEL